LACPKACGSSVSSIVSPAAPRFKFLHGAADIERVAIAMIGIDQHRQRRSARHPPHLFGKLRQRDQGNVGIPQHRERSHRAAEHADLEAEILGNADRGRVIDRARPDAA
jgi:hypothetical protein